MPTARRVEVKTSGASVAPAKSRPTKPFAPAASEAKRPTDHDEDSKITLDDLRDDMELAEPMEEDDLADDLPLEDDDEADADYLDKPEDLAAEDDDDFSRPR
jgi:hypothetical protein